VASWLSNCSLIIRSFSAPVPSEGTGNAAAQWEHPNATTSWPTLLKTMSFAMTQVYAVGGGFQEQQIFKLRHYRISLHVDEDDSDRYSSQCKVSSCWRRARFSRIRFSRDRKAPSREGVDVARFGCGCPACRHCEGKHWFQRNRQKWKLGQPRSISVRLILREIFYLSFRPPELGQPFWSFLLLVVAVQELKCLLQKSKLARNLTLPNS
jgi:hypothetical protein